MKYLIMKLFFKELLLKAKRKKKEEKLQTQTETCKNQECKTTMNFTFFSTKGNIKIILLKIQTS